MTITRLLTQNCHLDSRRTNLLLTETLMTFRYDFPPSTTFSQVLRIVNLRSFPVDDVQMDLVMAFGGFLVFMILALYGYWIFLKRAKLFDRVTQLRQDQLLKAAVVATPRQTTETRPVPFLSPFNIHPIPIKMEPMD
jgi:hypothetical protein